MWTKIYLRYILVHGTVYTFVVDSTSQQETIQAYLYYALQMSEYGSIHIRYSIVNDLMSTSIVINTIKLIIIIDYNYKYLLFIINVITYTAYF